MRGDSLEIKVDKGQLLATLRENREKHGAAYQKAKAGYVKVTTEQVKEYLTRLANGELLERALLPAPPEDHTGDYDDTIDMMEWSIDSEVLLDQNQFRQYIKDDWGWKQSWIASNTGYLEATR